VERCDQYKREWLELYLAHPPPPPPEEPVAEIVPPPASEVGVVAPALPTEDALPPMSEEEWSRVSAKLASTGPSQPSVASTGMAVPGKPSKGGIGDPLDGTMGWGRGYEGGRGLSRLRCGGVLKNVLRLETSDLGQNRALFVPQGIVDAFVALASENSSKPPRGIETCGILCGRITSRGELSLTTVLVPKQRGDSDSCELTDAGEMQVFHACSEQQLIQFGWIHTHPSQDCFMSSYDVRTHLGFQTMLPEAIAIVAAPKDPTLSYGTFRLIEPDGFAVVQSRPTDEHYIVPDGVLIYETTSHVRVVRGSAGSGSSGHKGGRGEGGIPLDGQDFELLDMRTD
jgi:proteasome lid subunit RPN8/RPN11